MPAPVVAVIARIAVRRAVLKKVKQLLLGTPKIKGNLKIPLPVPVATFEMAQLEQYLLLAERNTRKSFAELLREAVEWNPENAKANRLLGDALVSLGTAEDAERYFRKALELRPDDVL